MQHRLVFSLGEKETHDVDASLDDDGVVLLVVDGIERATLRKAGMIGGYTFLVGDAERHRVELFFIESVPPRLEARVDGVSVLPARPPSHRQDLVRRATIVVVVLAVLAVGAGIAGAAGSSWARRLGFDPATIALGGALLGIAPYIQRERRWAMPLATAAYLIELGVWAATSRGQAPVGGASARIAVGLLLVAAAVVLWRGRRRDLRPRTFPHAIVPDDGPVIGRCPEHTTLAHRTCSSCRRPLCPDCSAFSLQDALLCSTCAALA